MDFLWAFIIGGTWCVIAQLLMDLTDMTPANVLVSYVVIGVILQGVGLYEPLVNFAKCGATVPIIGFGGSLAKGVYKGIGEKGLLGAFSGGLTATSGGIAVAICFALPLSLFFKSKEK